MDPDRRWLLSEVLREAERAVDRVLRTAEEQDDKTEQTLALGVATLGGMLAVATLSAQVGALDEVGLAALASAVGTNLVALRALLESYLGLAGHRTLLVGPDPGWLAERLNDQAWTDVAHVTQVLRTYEANIHANLVALHSVTRSRAAGMKLLLVAWALGSLAAVYIVAGGLLR